MLWLFPSAGGDLVKFPYADIASVMWQPMGGHVWILGIVTRSGNRIAVEIRAPRGLGAALEQRVSSAPSDPVDPNQTSLLDEP